MSQEEMYSFNEAVFAGGKEKVKPVEEIFQKLKDKLEEQVQEQIKTDKPADPNAKEKPVVKNFNPVKFWKDPLWKQLEDEMQKAFGFRYVQINPYREKFVTAKGEFESKTLNATVYNEDRWPIEGLVTEKGFYDKSRSIVLDIYITLGLIRALDADEILAVLLHEFGHGIDPALVSIKYTEVNVLSKYMTDRKTAITEKEKKLMQKKMKASKFVEAIPVLGGAAIALIWALMFLYCLFSTIKDAAGIIIAKFRRNKKEKDAEEQKADEIEKRLKSIEDKVKNEPDFNRKEFSEAYADNFARMYGYGVPLASAFKKMNKIMDEKVKSRYAREQEREIFILRMTEDALKDCHKTDVHRVHALIQEYKADINDPNTPPKMKKQMEEDVKELEAILESYTKDFSEMQNRVNKTIVDALNAKSSKKETKKEEVKEVKESVDYITESVRDTRKDKDYWDAYIAQQNKRIAQRKEKLANGTGNAGSIYLHLAHYQLDLISAMYSAGESRSKISKVYADACESLSKLKPSQVTYQEKINVASFAILFGNKAAFRKVYNTFKSDYDRDKILNGFASYTLKGQAIWNGETPKALPYKRLVNIISGSDKADMLSKYLSGWYRACQDCAWYGSDKRDQNTYVGYWCWEAAALAKILNIKSDELSKNKFYPVV